MTTQNKWTLGIVVLVALVVAGLGLMVFGPKKLAQSRQRTLITNASVAMSQGKYARAYDLYKQLHGELPDSAGVILKLSELCVYLNRFDEARSWIDKASGMLPNEPYPRIQRAFCNTHEADYLLSTTTEGPEGGSFSRIETLCQQSEVQLAEVGKMTGASPVLQAQQGEVWRVRAEAALERSRLYQTRADEAAAGGRADEAAKAQKLADETRDLAERNTNTALKELSAAFKLSPKEMGLAEAYAQAAYRTGRWSDVIVAFRTASTVGRPTPRLAILAVHATRASVVGKPASARRQARQLCIEALEGAVKNHPYNPDVKLELAAARLESGSIEGAEELLKKVQTMGQKKTEASVLQGRILLAKDKPQEALTLLRSAEVNDPNQAALKVWLADAEGRCGSDKAALNLLSKAVELDPDNAEYRIRLAESLENAGQPAKSEQVLRTGLRRDPGSVSLVSAYTVWCVRNGYPDRMTGSIERAEKIVASRAQGPADLALLCLRAGRSDWAVRVASGLIKSDPKSLVAVLTTGADQVSKGKVAEAIETLKPLTVQKEQIPEVALTLSQACGAQGRLQDAAVQLEMATSAGENDYLTLYRAVEVCIQLGLFVEAVKYGNRMLADNSEVPGTLWQAGRLAVLTGDLPRATDLLTRLKRQGWNDATPMGRAVVDLLAGFYDKVAGDLRGQTDSLSHVAMHWAKVRLGMFDEAAAELEAAVRANALSAPLYLRVGDFFVSASKPEEGVLLLTRLGELNRGLAALGIARIRHLSGKHDQAIQACEAALSDKTLKMDKRIEGELRVAMASCFRHQDKPQDAIRVYQELEKDPAIGLMGLRGFIDMLIEVRSFQQVEDALDQFLKLPDLSADYLMEVGSYYQRIGKLEKAMLSYAQLARKLPDSVGPLRLQAGVCQMFGQSQRAIEILRGAMGRWYGSVALKRDLAEAYSQQGLWPDALATLSDAVLNAETAGGVAVERDRTILLMRMGLTEAARPGWESLKGRPGWMDFEALTGFAQCRAGQGDLEGAVKDLVLVPPTASQFVDARLIAARLERQRGRKKEALKLLQESLNRLDTSELLARALFDACIAERMWDDAVKIARKWASSVDGDAFGWTLYWADTLAQKGDIKGATEVLVSAPKAIRENRSMVPRVAVYLLAAEDAAGARKILAASATPTTAASAPSVIPAAAATPPITECLLGIVDLYEGKEREAAVRLDGLIRRDVVPAEVLVASCLARMSTATPLPLAQLPKAVQFGQDGALLAAMTEATSRPAGKKACRNAALSLLCRRIALNGLAMHWARQSVASDGESVGGYVLLRDALLTAGSAWSVDLAKCEEEIGRRFGQTALGRRVQIESAIDASDYDRVSAVLKAWDKASPPPVEVLYRSASVAIQKGRSAEALAWLEECLKRDPKNTDAANNVAYLLVELKGQDPAARERALKLAEESYRVMRGMPAVADTYGWVLVRCGRAKDALPILQKALIVLSGDVKVHYHIAGAYAGTGQIEMARLHYEHVAQSAKDKALIDEARKALSQLPKAPTTGPAASKQAA